MSAWDKVYRTVGALMTPLSGRSQFRTLGPCRWRVRIGFAPASLRNPTLSETAFPLGGELEVVALGKPLPRERGRKRKGASCDKTARHRRSSAPENAARRRRARFSIPCPIGSLAEHSK